MLSLSIKISLVKKPKLSDRSLCRRLNYKYEPGFFLCLEYFSNDENFQGNIKTILHINNPTVIIIL